MKTKILFIAVAVAAFLVNASPLLGARSWG